MTYCLCSQGFVYLVAWFIIENKERSIAMLERPAAIIIARLWKVNPSVQSFSSWTRAPEISTSSISILTLAYSHIGLSFDYNVVTAWCTLKIEEQMFWLSLQLASIHTCDFVALMFHQSRRRLSSWTKYSPHPILSSPSPLLKLFQHQVISLLRPNIGSQYAKDC